ncbi:hypothetical protein C8J56DRAFT_455674 [Mycena floridula]|nr:hypothetical protein C8J56DRAFT_455674 [Mycena floridula]
MPFLNKWLSRFKKRRPLPNSELDERHSDNHDNSDLPPIPDLESSLSPYHEPHVDNSAHVDTQSLPVNSREANSETANDIQPSQSSVDISDISPQNPPSLHFNRIRPLPEESESTPHLPESENPHLCPDQFTTVSAGMFFVLPFGLTREYLVRIVKMLPCPGGQPGEVRIVTPDAFFSPRLNGHLTVFLGTRAFLVKVLELLTNESSSDESVNGIDSADDTRPSSSRYEGLLTQPPQNYRFQPSDSILDLNFLHPTVDTLVNDLTIHSQQSELFPLDTRPIDLAGPSQSTPIRIPRQGLGPSRDDASQRQHFPDARPGIPGLDSIHPSSWPGRRNLRYNKPPGDPDWNNTFPMASSGSYAG